MKFDIHCHPALFERPDDYLIRRKCHTDALIAAGTSPNDWKTTLILAQTHNFVHPALGLHPWTVSQMSPYEAESAMNQLKQLTAQNDIAAISECGLDATRPQLELQIKIFKSHLELAHSHNLPIIIHCVKSYHIIEQLINKTNHNPLILHGFSGSPQLQMTLVSKGCFFSPGRNMLRKTPPTLIEAIHPFCLPETDDDGQHESDFDLILSRLPATSSDTALKLFSGRMSER